MPHNFRSTCVIETGLFDFHLSFHLAFYEKKIKKKLNLEL